MPETPFGEPLNLEIQVKKLQARSAWSKTALPQVRQIRCPEGAGEGEKK